MVLVEKKNEYQKGKLDKNTYMKEMFGVHRHLFEYPCLLHDSSVTNIKITKEHVIFTINNNGDSIKLVCDEKDAFSLPMIMLNLSETEAQEQAMVLNLIDSGDVVFDIGANIGWYTMNILLKRKGSTVYAFEPIKSSFNYLQQNLSLNDLSSAKIYNSGFADENKKVLFFHDVEYAMASSMANLREDTATVTEECEVRKLDDFVKSLPELKKIDFIKCDVEGAELFVFKGGVETIKRDHPVIFTEMLRKWSAKFDYHPNEIISLLAELGYACFTTENERLLPFAGMDENTVETNFFFLHKDTHSPLIHRFFSSPR